jgi:hypothetical protein
MIKFFRHIRQSHIMKNQTGKYLKYAIGEIVLVVIGILIALQINNWNEHLKKEKLKVSYKTSLKNDLCLDTLMLGKLIVENYEIMNTLESQQNRFLGPESPIDTLIKIAKNEFEPELNTRFKYNRNTFNTLVASGNIDLFSKDFNEMLMSLIALQDIERENSKYYTEVYSSKVSRYSDNFPVSKRNYSTIFNSVWNNLDEKKLASSFISLTDIKGFAHYSFANEIENVKKATITILKQMDSIK